MIDRLIEKIQKTEAPIVVGLDPQMNFIPDRIQEKAFREFGETLEGAAEAVWQFNKGIVDAVCDLVPAVKPQIAMYEQFGVPTCRVSENGRLLQAEGADCDRRYQERRYRVYFSSLCDWPSGKDPDRREGIRSL